MTRTGRRQRAAGLAPPVLAASARLPESSCACMSKSPWPSTPSSQFHIARDGLACQPRARQPKHEINTLVSRYVSAGAALDPAENQRRIRNRDHNWRMQRAGERLKRQEIERLPRQAENLERRPSASRWQDLEDARNRAVEPAFEPGQSLIDVRGSKPNVRVGALQLVDLVTGDLAPHRASDARSQKLQVDSTLKGDERGFQKLRSEP
jgi:hypothetical protein